MTPYLVIDFLPFCTFATALPKPLDDRKTTADDGNRSSVILLYFKLKPLYRGLN